MRVNSLVIGVAAVLSVASARAEDDFVDPGALGRAGLTKFWQLRLPLDPGQSLVDAYLVDSTLYLGTNDGYYFAVDGGTGAIRWLRQLTTAGYRIRKPTHAGDRVIFVTPAEVMQIERRYGEAISKLELRFPASTGPVTDGVRFFLGSLNQRFYAFDLQTQFESWKATTSGAITGTPALFGEHLFVASEDRGVYACVAADKRFHWQGSTTGPNVADLYVDDKGVFVASLDHSLYLFDLQFGQPRWRARLSGPLREPPVVAGDLAYQFCADDGLVAVETGVVNIEKRLRWVVPRGRTLLATHKEAAILLGRDENILVAGIKSGNVEHKIAVPGFTFGLPDPAGGSVYVAAADGRLFCARPRGVPYVRLEDLRNALTARAPGEAEAAAAPTKPTPPPAVRSGDYLETRPQGPPAGGKSKISREFKPETPSPSGGSGGAPGTPPPPTSRPSTPGG